MTVTKTILSNVYHALKPQNSYTFLVLCTNNSTPDNASIHTIAGSVAHEALIFTPSEDAAEVAPCTLSKHSDIHQAWI